MNPSKVGTTSDNQLIWPRLQVGLCFPAFCRWSSSQEDWLNGCMVASNDRCRKLSHTPWALMQGLCQMIMTRSFVGRKARRKDNRSKSRPYCSRWCMRPQDRGWRLHLSLQVIQLYRVCCIGKCCLAMTSHFNKNALFVGGSPLCCAFPEPEQ